MRFKLQGSVVAIVAMVVAVPALAHHSFAMFDRTKEVELAGVVKEFQWTNPHIWIELVVNEQGKAVVYSIEGSSPGGLSRKGWNRTTFKPGDHVKIVMNPLKESDVGGSFVRATDASGGAIGGDLQAP
jgi:hypothetical protein